jgi:glyoxylase-like metal-dependent hydrolase (beta-lactamase superfamily II)
MNARLATLCALGLAAAGTGCLSVPMAPDRPELWQFVAPKPGVKVELEITPLRTGHSNAPRCGAAGAESCFDRIEMVQAAYLVKHPNGQTFLIDASLDSHGKDDVKRFRWTTQLLLDYTSEGSLVEALKKAGDPKLDFVLLTHSHWDHAGGLRELDHPRVVMGPGEAEFVRSIKKDDQPVSMADHLAGAALESVTFEGPAYEEFPASHDWFGDGSVVLVPMPGHTPGSMGIFLNGVRGRRLLFIGDTGWSMDAVEGPSHKLKLASDLTDWNRPLLAEALWRLHHLHRRDPSVLIVPAHDASALKAVQALAAGGAGSASR